MSLIETHSLPCQTSTNAKALASIARLAAVLLIVGAATENVTRWLFLLREKILITACDVCYWRAPWKGGAFQWVQVPPGKRSSRKQPEQLWR